MSDAQPTQHSSTLLDPSHAGIRDVTNLMSADGSTAAPLADSATVPAASLVAPDVPFHAPLDVSLVPRADDGPIAAIDAAPVLSADDEPIAAIDAAPVLCADDEPIGGAAVEARVDAADDMDLSAIIDRMLGPGEGKKRKRPLDTLASMRRTHLREEAAVDRELVNGSHHTIRDIIEGVGEWMYNEELDIDLLVDSISKRQAQLLVNIVREAGYDCYTHENDSEGRLSVHVHASCSSSASGVMPADVGSD